MDVTFITTAGTRRTAHIVKRPYTIPTLSHTRVYTAGGRRVGYIFFRNFVEPSLETIDTAFATLAPSGSTIWSSTFAITEEASLALRSTWPATSAVYADGRSDLRRVFPQRQASRAQPDSPLREKPAVAPFDRLIVITTGSSASASELVINALRPFMPVILIGDRTGGKPVGQRVFTFCDKALAPVSFVLRNANGEGDFFQGGSRPPAARPTMSFRGSGSQRGVSEGGARIRRNWRVHPEAAGPQRATNVCPPRRPKAGNRS